MAEASLADLPAPPEATADSLPAPPEQPASSSSSSSSSSSFKDEAIDVARGVAKGVVSRAVAMPAMAADALTAAGNLANRGVNKLAGTHLPDEPMPSGAIDQIFGESKTKAGKAVETISSILSPTARGIEAGEQALLRSGKLAELEIAGGKLPESERIRKQGNSVGFQYSPSEVPNATVSRQVTSLTGKARQEEEVSAHNLDKTQELTAAEFHLPKGTEFTDETLKRLQQPAYATYEKVANLGDIQTSPEYRDEIAKAGSWGAQVEKDFPDDTPQKVLALRGAMARAQFTGRGALEKIKQLREDYRTNIRGDTEDKALAKAQKDAANALEKELGRKAAASGQPQLMEQFQNARKYLAKIGAVRDAIVNGQVSARSLAGQLEDGVPLDGNLKIIAESALQNPKSFQDVQKKGRMAAYTVHDLWAIAAGSMGLITGSREGAAVAGLAAASLARPVARAAVRSRAVQKAITRPSSERIGAKASSALVRHPGAGTSAALQAGLGADQDLGEASP